MKSWAEKCVEYDRNDAQTKLRAATERIAALEGALGEAVVTLESEITSTWVVPANVAQAQVARLRAVLGKDG